jgi:predicted transcriptional regulator
MDKIVSMRIDESLAALLDSLARSLGKPKKQILEQASRSYAESLDRHAGVFDETCRAWSRSASTAEVHGRIRGEFERSMRRRHS